MFWCLQVAALLLCILPFARAAYAQDATFQSHQRKVALVVGVGTYESVAALRNPLNDATAISGALERLGFEVVVSRDPKREALDTAMKEFLRILPGADIAMFYYAGHSIQIDGRNFLIPTDAVLSDAKSVDTYLMDSAFISDLMDRYAAVRITVLDACRDNPFVEVAKSTLGGQSRSISRGLAAFPEPGELQESQGTQVYGSVIAYAAAPGRTALDGDGTNSPYTTALLKHIEEPGLEIGRMFRNVASEVLAVSAGQQQPEYLVRLTDEVYFKVPEPHQCDILAAAPYNSVGVEGVDFERINHRAAIPACTAALEEDPGHPRYLYNLGRAYDAAGDFSQAVALYEKSSREGYAAATSSLGVMRINGQGTPQDFLSGVALLKEARSLGSRTAKISLTYSDFSVLFEGPEFKEVQRSLKDRGFYTGAVDGDFGPRSKKALSAFQDEKGLTAGGLTLETLDALDLVRIIPNYELN